MNNKSIFLEKLSKESLNSLYCDKYLSTATIAKMHNCNAETIRRYLIRFKIERRKLHQRKYDISKEKLENLYSKNKMSTIEIARELSCSQWVVWSLLKHYDIKLRGPNDYHSWKSPANQIKPILDPSSTLSYVIAVILGDGWTYKMNHTYSIGLEVQDKIFCDNFSVALKKLGLNPSVFKNKTYWRVAATSKLFYEWFESLSFNEIKVLVKNYPIDFIRGFYESEGSFSAYKSKKYNYTTLTITIVNTNKDLMSFVKELLEGLGFHPSMHKREKLALQRNPIWAVLIGKKLEVKLFLDMIKPCIKIGEKRRNETFKNRVSLPTRIVLGGNLNDYTNSLLVVR